MLIKTTSGKPMVAYNSATRITDTTATVLDQIWTNTQSEEAHTYILVDSLPDHLPILLLANFANKSTNQISMIKKRFFLKLISFCFKIS